MYDLALGVEGLVHLEIGEPDFSTPQHIIDAAKRALDEGHTHYTPNAGYKDLREQIAKKVLEDNGIEARPESDIIVTAGAMQAISSAILVTIDPGDEVLIPDPGYESFSRQVKFADGVPVPVQVKEEEEFRLNPKGVEKAITKKTKMIVVNTPSNPTGSVMAQEDLEGIAELAKQHDLLVLSDEIYEKILYDGAKHHSIASFPDMADRTITVFAFSKTYAMTGWRVGYAVGPKPIVKEMTKIQEFYVTCAPSICQRAALAALEGSQDCVREMLHEFSRRRDFMYNELTQLKRLSCVRPKGAFYLFPNIAGTGLRSEETAKILLEKGKVVTAPGRAFGKHGDNFLRISLGTSIQNLKSAAERIRTMPLFKE